MYSSAFAYRLYHLYEKLNVFFLCTHLKAFKIFNMIHGFNAVNDTLSQHESTILRCREMIPSSNCDWPVLFCFVAWWDRLPSLVFAYLNARATIIEISRTVGYKFIRHSRAA